VLLNGFNIFELVTGARIPLSLENRIRVIVFGAAVFGLGLLWMKWLIKQYPLLQSSEQMHVRSQQLTHVRKVTLFAVVIGNFILLIALSAYLRR
jgi:hypothetical protein